MVHCQLAPNNYSTIEDAQDQICEEGLKKAQQIESNDNWVTLSTDKRLEKKLEMMQRSI